MFPTMPPPPQIKVFEQEDWRETVTKISIPKVLLSPSTTLRSFIPIEKTRDLGETNPSTSPRLPYVLQRGAALQPSLKVPDNCTADYAAEIAAIIMAVLWLFSICVCTIKITRNNCSWFNFWVFLPCSGQSADSEETELGLRKMGKVFKKNLKRNLDFFFIYINRLRFEPFLSVLFFLILARDIRKKGSKIGK